MSQLSSHQTHFPLLPGVPERPLAFPYSFVFIKFSSAMQWNHPRSFAMPRHHRHVDGWTDGRTPTASRTNGLACFIIKLYYVRSPLSRTASNLLLSSLLRVLIFSFSSSGSLSVACFPCDLEPLVSWLSLTFLCLVLLRFSELSCGDRHACVNENEATEAGWGSCKVEVSFLLYGLLRNEWCAYLICTRTWFCFLFCSHRALAGFLIMLIRAAVWR